MKNYLIPFILVLVVALGAWLVLHDTSDIESVSDTSDTSEITSDTNTLLSTVVYSCDEGRTISAAYYQGTDMPQAEAGEPPVPTGSVEVSMDGAASSTLMQTISASGVRYANEDESFVFWNKGDEALVMHDNSMDLNYSNCVSG